MIKRFPASIPRKMFWSKDVGGKSDCPECGARLESEHHTYVMAIREVRLIIGKGLNTHDSGTCDSPH